MKKSWNFIIYKEQNKQLVLTFVPRRRDILLSNRYVEITIDPTIGKLIRFNAHSYFSFYGKEAPSEYRLSEKDILNIISDKAKVIGTPTLEVIAGRSGSDVLVYSASIEGIDKVKKVYINAINGKNEGIIYEDYEDIHVR